MMAIYYYRTREAQCQRTERIHVITEQKLISLTNTIKQQCSRIIQPSADAIVIGN